MGDTNTRGGFATRFGFIFAAAGSAVGLGNIWKFPYITGEYGGGAFVLVYLACILLVGLPLMYAELVIGRRGGKDVLGGLLKLTSAHGSGARDLSLSAGGMAVASGFLILSFYSVVAGWAIHFFWVALGVISMDPAGAAATFTAVSGNPLLSSVWHTLFMLMTVAVVARGVDGGIERLCSRLMPALVGILLILLVYVGFTGGLAESLSFLFKPDFSKLSGEAVLEALGHAFFTLSLGMGAMVTYGSYLRTDTNIVRDGMWVAVLDTLIALLAGAVIFAVVFSGGGEAAGGPGLVFMTLPDLFATMPLGMLVAAAFFLLLVFAAWSSAVSLLEVVVAWLVDEHGVSRMRASWCAGSLVWLLGLSVARWGAVLDFLDNLTTRYMLPVGGLCIAIAAGWLLSREDREAGFAGLPGAAWMAPLWTVLIRFVTPTLVLFVIVAKMGLFEPSSPATSPAEGSSAQGAALVAPVGDHEELLEAAMEIWFEISDGLEKVDRLPVDAIQGLIYGLEKARHIASLLPIDQRPEWFSSIDDHIGVLNKRLKLRATLDEGETKLSVPAAGPTEPSAPSPR